MTPTPSHHQTQPAEAKPIVELLPYQRALVGSSARFTWGNWSRQVGKSFAFSLRRILRGLERGRSQLLLSASERQSRELMQKVRQHGEALRIATGTPASCWVESSRAGLEMALPNGVRVIGLPANPQTVRGFTGDVFLDEFAMHRDDRAIWAAIFPTILRGQGELDVASTPKGLGNLFAELADNERFERSTVTIFDAVDQGLDVDIDALKAAMGDEQLFLQEFCCRFLDESTSLLTYEQIAGCEDGSLERDLDVARLQKEEGLCGVGVDVGRKRDLTVIWVFRREDETLVTLGLMELRGAPFQLQEQRIAEVLSCRAVRRCCIDATGLGMHLAESTVARFGEARVEPVTFSSAVKTDLAGRLRMLVESRRVRIPAEVDVRNDWHAVKRSVGAGGRVRFEADRSVDGHADRFWAAALASRACHQMAGPAEYTFRGRLDFAREGAW